MTPEREKAFEAYVAALRAAFETHEDAVIRVALTPSGSDRPVAFALVVGHQDLNENGRMALLSELFRQMSPHTSAKDAETAKDAEGEHGQEQR